MAPRRKSLSEVFQGLNISSNASPPPTMETMIASTFKKKGWPSWTSSISKASSKDTRLYYTIKMDANTRAYIPLEDETPSEVFQKATGFFETVRTKVEEKGSEGVRVVSQILINHLSAFIFGSNYIERVGLNLEETIKICERIFRGETVNPDTIPGRSSDYEKKLIEAIKPKMAVSHIIRSRREVVQHALALQYIVTEMVFNDNPLSEAIILKTHRILTEKIDAPGGTSWENYAGKYRIVPVHAGSTNFVAPKFVRQKVLELVEEYNNDILNAETTKALDPFTLAAKYCNDFVMIHPFLDGNGRMCRLILNAILLKYAGVIVSIGEHDESRTEYINIQKRAGERMEGSGELASLVLKKATVRYRTMKQKLTGKKKD